MEEYELSNLENSSKENYYAQIQQVLIECPSILETVSDKNDFSEISLSVFKYCRKKDYIQRCNYEKRRKLKKVNKRILSKKNLIFE